MKSRSGSSELRCDITNDHTTDLPSQQVEVNKMSYNESIEPHSYLKEHKITAIL